MIQAIFSDCEARKVDGHLQEARAWLIFMQTRPRRKNEPLATQDAKHLLAANQALGRVQTILLQCNIGGAS